MKKVAVLSTAITDENIEISTEFSRRLNEALTEHSFTTIFYKDLIFSIIDGKSSITDSVSGTDLADYDRAYIKSWFRFDEAATAISNYLELNGVPFDPEELGEYRSRSKVSETFIMNKLGIPVPDTVYAIQPSQKNAYLSDNLQLSYPIIIKVIDGGSGALNFLCKSKEDLEKVLDENPNVDFMLNGYLENDFDFRVLILDGEIKLVIKRQRLGNDSHLNNTSQGADGTVVDPSELPQDVRDKCILLSKHMKRMVSGVDVLETHDGRYFFLEINKSPQITSGAAQDVKSDLFTEYFRKKLN